MKKSTSIFSNSFVKRSNRPLINKLVLDYVMNYKSGDQILSLMLKSCFFFYHLCIDDPNTFQLLNFLKGEGLLPWNVSQREQDRKW